MTVFTAHSDLPTMAASWSKNDCVIVSLCAAWCDTCTQFREVYERIAVARPNMLFVWLDIEDDSEVCGDIDVENFPTLAVFRGDVLVHFGVSLPQQGAVARLIDELALRQPTIADAPPAVRELPHRVQRLTSRA